MYDDFDNVQCEDFWPDDDRGFDPREEDCGCGDPHCPRCSDWDESEDGEGYQMSDVEADADTLASAGWGMDEDYFHGEDDHCFDD